MKDFEKGKVTIRFSSNAEEGNEINGYIHKSKFWAVHRTHEVKKSEYKPLNKRWTITHAVVGLSLIRDMESKEKAVYVLDRVLEKYKALLECKNQDYWDIIAKSYGEHIRKSLPLIGKEYDEKFGKGKEKNNGKSF
ncbi:MAG: hypothetical protein Q8P81_03505 [Nanoarchaeota archaeon]|nr:hypothetical protein [Nanoarchaeota archaeon]